MLKPAQFPLIRTQKPIVSLQDTNLVKKMPAFVRTFCSFSRNISVKSISPHNNKSIIFIKPMFVNLSKKSHTNYLLPNPYKPCPKGRVWQEGLSCQTRRVWNIDNLP